VIPGTHTVYATNFADGDLPGTVTTVDTRRCSELPTVRSARRVTMSFANAACPAILFARIAAWVPLRGHLSSGVDTPGPTMGNRAA
jgi:hypothetical protein